MPQPLINKDSNTLSHGCYICELAWQEAGEPFPKGFECLKKKKIDSSIKSLYFLQLGNLLGTSKRNRITFQSFSCPFTTLLAIVMDS